MSIWNMVGVKHVVWWSELRQHVADMPFVRRRELRKEMDNIQYQIKNLDKKILDFCKQRDGLKSEFYKREIELKRLRKK